MTIREKVKAVESVFQELDAALITFKNESRLNCVIGCGKCCFKPTIEATPLEFLPFALALYKDGKAFQWMEKLKTDDSSVCLILKPLLTEGEKGMCSEYNYRGLICRLFGFSARVDKYGKKQLVTCQTIKTNQPEAFDNANLRISEGLQVPVMSHYYMKLLSIDPELGRQFYPINKAILKAIETVLQYYTYRTKRSA